MRLNKFFFFGKQGQSSILCTSSYENQSRRTHDQTKGHINHWTPIKSNTPTPISAALPFHTNLCHEDTAAYILSFYHCNQVQSNPMFHRESNSFKTIPMTTNQSPPSDDVPQNQSSQCCLSRQHAHHNKSILYKCVFNIYLQ